MLFSNFRKSVLIFWSSIINECMFYDLWAKTDQVNRHVHLGNFTSVYLRSLTTKLKHVTFVAHCLNIFLSYTVIWLYYQYKFAWTNLIHLTAHHCRKGIMAPIPEPSSHIWKERETTSTMKCADSASVANMLSPSTLPVCSIVVVWPQTGVYIMMYNNMVISTQ